MMGEQDAIGKKGRWRVMVNVGTTVYVTVEAESADEAIESVADLPQLCAYCSGWNQPWGRDEWEPDWDKAEAEPLGDDE